MALEEIGGQRVRQWLAEGSDIRAAAVQAAIWTWGQRRQTTVPKLTYVVRAAHAASLQRALVVAAAGSSGGGASIPAVVVQWELAVAAILACANPCALAGRQPFAGAPGCACVPDAEECVIAGKTVGCSCSESLLCGILGQEDPCINPIPISELYHFVSRPAWTWFPTSQ